MLAAVSLTIDQTVAVPILKLVDRDLYESPVAKYLKIYWLVVVCQTSDSKNT